jgi:hypothetical protein
MEKLVFFRVKRKKHKHVKIAYHVYKHQLFPYDSHHRNGDVIYNGKIIGNTHEGSMICGLSAINKIVFK